MSIHHTPPALPPAPWWADPTLTERHELPGGVGVTHSARFGEHVELCRHDSVAEDGTPESVTEVVVNGTWFLTPAEAEELSRQLLRAAVTW